MTTANPAGARADDIEAASGQPSIVFGNNDENTPPSQQHTLLKPKHRKPPPSALHQDSLIHHGGLNRHEYAIPTPYPGSSPQHPRFRTNATTAVAAGSSPDRVNHASVSRDRSADSQLRISGQALIHGLDSAYESLRFKERIKHFTWTWFTMTMATGQLANVIYQIPFKFQGQYPIACTIFIFNICLFVFNVCMISARFRLYPATFLASFTHPTESLFVPAAVVSFGTILLNITEFGTDSGRAGEWLSRVMVVFFWIYCGLALVFGCGIYLIMWSTQSFTISQMTPVWVFPCYPLLIIGPHAGILSARTTAHDAIDIIVGGVAFQGIGFMIATMVYAAFLYRLMTNKLPTESLRPGMFISVGPSGFTIAGIVNMGQNIGRVIPADFMGVGQPAATISMVLANWVGIWLWGLAIFFLIVSIGAHHSCVGPGKMIFAMNWYSFVFPNTGLIAATFALGKALNNHPIRIFGCVLTGILVVVWIFVFVMMIRAVVLKQILWPQKGEDRDEHGWNVTRNNVQRMDTPMAAMAEKEDDTRGRAVERDEKLKQQEIEAAHPPPDDVEKKEPRASSGQQDARRGGLLAPPTG